MSQLIFGNISSWIRLPVENSVKNARATGNSQKSVFSFTCKIEAVQGR